MGRWHGGHGGLALPLPGVRSSAKLGRWQRRVHNVEERSGVHGLPASLLAQRAWWSRGAVLELRSRVEFGRALLRVCSLLVAVSRFSVGAAQPHGIRSCVVLHAQHARFVSCAVAPLPWILAAKLLLTCAVMHRHAVAL